MLCFLFWCALQMHTERYIDPKTEKVNCNRFLGKPCVNVTNFLLLLFLSFDCTYKAVKQVNYKREEKQKKDGVFKNHCVACFKQTRLWDCNTGSSQTFVFQQLELFLNSHAFRKFRLKKCLKRNHLRKLSLFPGILVSFVLISFSPHLDFIHWHCHLRSSFSTKSR